MLKMYRVGTRIFQFEEGEQPNGAEEVIINQPKKETVAKTRKPANKARETKNK